MKLLYVVTVMLLSSCYGQEQMVQIQKAECDRCIAETWKTCQSSKEKEKFKRECTEVCKPNPPVTDTESTDPKAWRCGCVPAERR